MRVICGPTAGGKSALAMQLAERNGAAIISADSRQIYRGFDIGTAKPEKTERNRVPHFGVDIIDPTERYSAARWADDARRWIAASTSNGRIPLIVGGTGLYIKALFEPLSPVPSLDPVRRAEMESFLTARTTEELREWCKFLDPARAHLGKTQLIRAIETALLSGERLSESHKGNPTKEGGDGVSQADVAATRARDSEARGRRRRSEDHGPETPSPTDSAVSSNPTPIYLLVDPMQSLQTRIETRVDQMLSRGWVDEVAKLAKTIPETAPAWKASGYSAMRDVVRGAADLATARARVIIETRQYAKRQRTWFRHQLPSDSVTRLDPESPGGDLLVQRWWESGEAGA